MFINDGVFNNHVKDIQKHIPFVTASNSGNTYSIQIDDLDYLEDGQAIMVKFNAASTGAISLSVNGGTAKSIVDYFNNPVTNVRAGLIAHLVYSADDSNFQLQGKGGDGDALITDIRQGKKATTREGLITGVLPVQATAAQEVVPGTSDIVKPAGIYDGDITIKGIQPSDIGGRKYATGHKDTGLEFSGPYTVSSLTFKPSIIFVKCYYIDSSHNYIYTLYNTAIEMLDDDGNTTSQIEVGAYGSDSIGGFFNYKITNVDEHGFTYNLTSSRIEYIYWLAVE